MLRVGRVVLSAGEKAELWTKWKAGVSISEIGRTLGRSAGSVFSALQAKGGFAPVARKRRQHGLTPAEREDISRGLANGLSSQQLARQLGRAASTISREVARNGGRGRYRAQQAEEHMWRRAARAKPCVLNTTPALQSLVAEKLHEKWSPQQVAGWLKTMYPGDCRMQVSHETIYKSLFIQARGALKKELVAVLRSRRVMRRGRPAKTTGQSRGHISEAVSIRERPAEIEDRAVPGHWEGDLISGKANTHIATLVERRSRYVMLVKLGGKDSETVVSALVHHIQSLPRGLMASLTWDRGKEMAQHKRFTIAANVAVYFCDPQSPWQRGSNENTNGLLRQYFPKGTDLSRHSQEELDAVARQMNMRPRETLGFRTPADILNAAVALTG